MSGGSLDYIYYKVEDVARILIDKNQPIYRRVFGEHLLKVSKALHDVEWAMSGDIGDEDDKKSIEDIINIEEESIKILRDDAKTIINELQKLLYNLEEGE